MPRQLLNEEVGVSLIWKLLTGLAWFWLRRRGASLGRDVIGSFGRMRQEGIQLLFIFANEGYQIQRCMGAQR